METTIYESHTIFYIPAILKLDFHLLHVRIFGTNHCGEMRRTAFKRCELFQDVLSHLDYAERLVASFVNKIQSEYYGGKISVYIECISLEHFSAVPQTNINSTTPSLKRNALFYSFLPDDSKQDADTTTAYRNI